MEKSITESIMEIGIDEKRVIDWIEEEIDRQQISKLSDLLLNMNIKNLKGIRDGLSKSSKDSKGENSGTSKRHGKSRQKNVQKRNGKTT